jgi:hypothetical protein
VEKPESISSDYGVRLAGASSSQGDALAVLGNSKPGYSTLAFTPSGSTSVGYSDVLTDHHIGTLALQPIFIGDGTGNIAIVNMDDMGKIMVANGKPDMLGNIELNSGQPPDAATFAGSNIYVSAMSTGILVPNLLSTTGHACLVEDEAGTVPIGQVVAMVGQSTELLVWTKTGMVFSYNLSAVENCAFTMTTLTILPATAMRSFQGPVPNQGGQLSLVGNFAVFTSFDSNTSMMGQVAVFDLTNPTNPMQVGTAIPALGAQSVVVDKLGTTTTVAVGFPNRAVDTTDGAGSVELHTLDETTGMLDATAMETLSIPQADSLLNFGRSIATMQFNGKTILTVGASNVVYAYYQTALYENARQ